MRVTVKYMAQLKQAAGVVGEVVEIVSPCAIESILRQLSERRTEAFRRLVLDSDGQMQKAILVFLGEEQVRVDAPHDFKDGDVLTILAPMAGG